jgi:hypothetical protein
MPLARICSNALTSAFLSLLTGQRIRDSQCGYRVYAVEMLRRMSIEYDRFEMESEVILKASRLRFPIRFVRVQTVYSRDIGSHISHVRDTLRWVKAVLGVWLRME